MSPFGLLAEKLTSLAKILGARTFLTKPDNDFVNSKQSMQISKEPSHQKGRYSAW